MSQVRPLVLRHHYHLSHRVDHCFPMGEKKDTERRERKGGKQADSDTVKFIQGETDGKVRSDPVVHV